MRNAVNPNDIDSTYKVLEKIGKGTFAKVRKARHKLTGKIVALKVFLLDELTIEDQSSILKEINFLMALNHRNVVRLIDVFESSNSRYVVIVLEHMQSTLVDYLKTHQIIGEDEAKPIFHMIASGVRHCHENGIVHCDLKPANILVNIDDN